MTCMVEYVQSSALLALYFSVVCNSMNNWACGAMSYKAIQHIHFQTHISIELISRLYEKKIEAI
jgi:hypothetical protein